MAPSLPSQLRHRRPGGGDGGGGGGGDGGDDGGGGSGVTVTSGAQPPAAAVPPPTPALALLPSADGPGVHGGGGGGRFWVPLRVPLRRRLQTLAVLGFMLLGPLQLACWFWTGCALLNPLTTLPMVAYLLFIARGDPSVAAVRRYDRLRPSLRACGLLRLFTGYFPMVLVRTAALPPARRYVFGVHPHGVISMGAFSHFCTAATGWDALFPGVRPHLLTLAANVKVPFFRELLLALRVVDASRETCGAVLAGPPGAALAIVVGGAAEALDARPGTYVVHLQHRGFVRVAAAAGADLVPVLSFHENDLFRTLSPRRASPLRRAQEWVKRTFRWAPVLFHGRGAFNYYVGLLPYRRRVVTVVGAPIPVPRVAGDLRRDAECVALVDAVHRQYAAALRELFFAHADRYDPHRRADIDIRM